MSPLWSPGRAGGGGRRAASAECGAENCRGLAAENCASRTAGEVEAVGGEAEGGERRVARDGAHVGALRHVVEEERAVAAARRQQVVDRRPLQPRHRAGVLAERSSGAAGAVAPPKSHVATRPASSAAASRPDSSGDHCSLCTPPPRRRRPRRARARRRRPSPGRGGGGSRRPRPPTRRTPFGLHAAARTALACPRSASASCRLCRSKIRTTASAPPAARYREPGLHVRQSTAGAASSDVERPSVSYSLPSGSESAIVPSREPDASTRSFDVHRTHVVGAACGENSTTGPSSAPAAQKATSVPEHDARRAPVLLDIAPTAEEICAERDEAGLRKARGSWTMPESARADRERGARISGLRRANRRGVMRRRP